MNSKIKSTVFLTAILGLFTLAMCTENSILFSSSIAMICTMSGVFIGQLIKKKSQVHRSMLWRLAGLFLLSIVISFCFKYFADDNETGIIYIILTNLILALGAISYLMFSKQ